MPILTKNRTHGRQLLRRDIRDRDLPLDSPVRAFGFFPRIYMRSIPCSEYSFSVILSHVIDLLSIRKAVGITQVQLAERLGVGQAQVSKTENKVDFLLSTLASYLRALGVEAELTVRVPGGRTLNYSITAESDQPSDS